MINCSELRIGNYVQPSERHIAAFGGKNLAVITGINETFFTVCNHYPGKWFEPIPLVKDWFLKFGFYYEVEKIGGGCPGTYIAYYNGKVKVMEWTKWDKGYKVIKNTFILQIGVLVLDCSDLDYVHQLQNLYFALTGEELTI